MTTKELNRDIKRLWKEREKQDGTAAEYWDWIESDFKKEFLRLYNADSQCEYMNLKSFKIMYRLNQCHRMVPFAFAWINMDVNKK